MPRLIKSARAKPGSNSPANPPSKAAPPSPQFTESKQSSSSEGGTQPENSPDSAEWLSLDATEPFPPGLFRVPVPNAVFSAMPELSDSALQCLLALLHLSFRFDPTASEWIHPGAWVARSDVEGACGLSSQGARNGLAELDDLGWVRTDRSGRSHQYQLRLSVPTKQFTYLPTALLEQIGAVGSGTELRVVLAVLRGTWGWTGESTDPQSGRTQTVHDRWAHLSNGKLAEMTGRSETAVRQAAAGLQGEWVERVRPGRGPYQYRFLPEAIGDGSGDPDSFSESTSNDLTPHRQKSDPPSSYRKSLSRNKHSRPSKTTGPKEEEVPPSGERNAVPSSKKRSRRSERTGPNRTPPEKSDDQSSVVPFNDLSPEKRDLVEKLRNVGVWPDRIAEVLSRFAPSRIRANFQLYRERAAEQNIRSPGAWLYRAVTEGYALPDSRSEAPSEGSSADSGSLPPLEHKETVSAAEKDAYVARGIGEDRFHRCLSGRKDAEGPRFMYFDPEVGGPAGRRT